MQVGMSVEKCPVEPTGVVVLTVRVVITLLRPPHLLIGMTTFGASAPLKELQRYFGFEPERVVAAAEELLGRKK